MIKAKENPNYWTYTIIGYVIPFVGFILSIILLSKDKQEDKSLGGHLFFTSFLAATLYTITGLVVNFSLNQ